MNDDRHRRRFDLYGKSDGRGRIHLSANIGDQPEHRSCPDGYEGVIPRVHASAVIEAGVTIDAGMERSTKVGARSYLMKKCHVGHDAQIGDDVDLAPLVNIGGYVTIGDSAKIGMSAVVLPFRTVGAHARVGAGAVVTRNVPPGATVVGNPARQLEDHERNPRPFSERAEAPRGSGCRCYDEGHDPRTAGALGNCRCTDGHAELLDLTGAPVRDASLR